MTYAIVKAANKATLTCPVCKTWDVCRMETSIYEKEGRT